MNDDLLPVVPLLCLYGHKVETRGMVVELYRLVGTR
jgi:hypothetical protein